MGRPTDYTPETVAIILRALENGATRKASAAIAGVSERSFHEWRQLYPDFSQQVEHAQAAFMERSTKVIGGHAPSLLKWLAMLHRDDKQLEPLVDKLDISGHLITTYGVELIDDVEEDTPADPAPAAPAGDSE